jgi:hypothetical protein
VADVAFVVVVDTRRERRLFELDPQGPVVSPQAIRLLAQSGGVLVGAIVNGAVRTWLADPTGQLTLVVWPQGFQARFDPLELLDERGQTVAIGGEHVTVGGAQLVKRDGRRTLGHERAFIATGKPENRSS